jgi:hypothetical protein
VPPSDEVGLSSSPQGCNRGREARYRSCGSLLYNSSSINRSRPAERTHLLASDSTNACLPEKQVGDVAIAYQLILKSDSLSGSQTLAGRVALIAPTVGSRLVRMRGRIEDPSGCVQRQRLRWIRSDMLEHWLPFDCLNGTHRSSSSYQDT